MTTKTEQSKVIGRQNCKEELLLSQTWKLAVFILTRVDSYQHRAMKCFRGLGVRRCRRTKNWPVIFGGGGSRQQKETITTISFHSQLPHLYYFSYTISSSHTGMRAGKEVFLPSVHPSLCLCAWSQTERKLTSFDRLLVGTFPILLGDGDSGTWGRLLLPVWEFTLFSSGYTVLNISSAFKINNACVHIYW